MEGVQVLNDLGHVKFVLLFGTGFHLLLFLAAVLSIHSDFGGTIGWR